MIPFFFLFWLVGRIYGQNDTIAIKQRPKMINLINAERFAHNLPFLCQDSSLSSIAQQHANDMAALDYLGTDLPCDATVVPPQYCTTANRLSRLNSSFENVIQVLGNHTARMAMLQLGQSAAQSSNLINPDIKYVGVGVAFNNQSNNYYWSQVFSTGNFSGVNCTDRPRIETINAQNITHVYTQPAKGLNHTLYPQLGLKDLKCRLVPVKLEEVLQLQRVDAPPTNSTLQQGKVASFLLSALSSFNDSTNNLTLPMHHVSPTLLAGLRLNATLQAIQSAIANDTSLLGGLNGTDATAYSRLLTVLQSNPNVTSIAPVPASESKDD